MGKREKIVYLQKLNGKLKIMKTVTLRPEVYDKAAYLASKDKLNIDDWVNKTLLQVVVKAPVSKKKSPDLRTCFSGEWENEKSTTEVDDEYRAARYFEPKDLTW